jgi:integrase
MPRRISSATAAPVSHVGELTSGVGARRRALATRSGADVELELIGLHECRHTFVSLMVAAGRSLEEVGDYVGHSSAYMTDRYRHLLDGARVEAAAALDALLLGQR